MFTYTTRERKVVLIPSDIYKFDHSKKTIAERNQFVEELIDDNIEMIEKFSTTQDSAGKQYLEQNLEKLGTFLLRSKDIKTARSIDEYTFYEEESDVNKIKSHNMTVPKDLEDNIAGYYDPFKEEEQPYGTVWHRFNFGEMDDKTKIKFIKIGLKEKDNHFNPEQTKYQEAYEYICDIAGSDNVKIIEMLMDNKKQVEIAKEMGISQPAIYKKIIRIMNEM